jgi:DNA-binding transcriptional ArsR family regulator
MAVSRARSRSPRLTYEADLFRALADPTRERIVQLLCTPGAGVMLAVPAGDVARDLKLAPSTVSHHLQVLLEARVVSVSTAGRERLYTLDLGRLRTAATTWLDGLAMVERATEHARDAAARVAALTPKGV